MARFTAGDFAVRFDKIDMNELWRGSRTAETSTKLQVELSKSVFLTFNGYGFQHHSSGSVTKGTVTSLTETIYGLKSFYLTDLKVSASALYGRVLARDEDGFMDLLFGKNDNIRGSQYKDYLTGRGGNDTIKGHDGNDTLVGGDGRDTLLGGDGDDSFVFSTTDAGYDRITDFSVRDDRISIDRPGGRSNVQASQFVNGTKALDASDRVIYNKDKGAIYYDPDGSGAKDKILLGMVKPGLRLSDDDFLFI